MLVSFLLYVCNISPGSGSVFLRQQDPDPDLFFFHQQDPDPSNINPDPQHWFVQYIF